jgi:hypothetical protein
MNRGQPEKLKILVARRTVFDPFRKLRIAEPLAVL